MTFAHFGLRKELLKAIQKRGYETPTTVQNKSIPVILTGRDVFVRAQTGTGKTDAFALPMVEILSRKKSCGRHPRALVLTPTRELAQQVGESLKDYARRLSLRCTVVHGGVRIEPQTDRLRRGIDILVATPGRLLDLIELRCLHLSEIEFLVFDEADRMLDLGFSVEISEILDLVSKPCRTLLFSATYTQQIRNFAATILEKPEYIEVVTGVAAADEITQKVHLVDQPDKINLLVHLISREHWQQVLVFTRTKYGADKLTQKLLDRGLSAAGLHGDKSQTVRSQTLDAFKNRTIRILVATDLAARGLDINNLPFVVNFDMPVIPEDYIHRIGRTGRAGVKGIAISLVSRKEMVSLKAIEKLLKQKIWVEKVDGYSEDGAIPDHILYRPGNAVSEKNVDPDLKALLDKRAARKLHSKSASAKAVTSRKGTNSSSKSRSGSRPKQSANQRKARGRR